MFFRNEKDKTDLLSFVNKTNSYFLKVTVLLMNLMLF